MKIYLVGMPASGKTTLGKQLANALLLPFIDLDEEIEKHESRTVSDIFSQQGEAFFRLIESKLLKDFSTSPQHFVMATGGGAPCHYNGIDIINQSGISIFLDVSIGDLMKRVASQKGRPLLNTIDENERERCLKQLKESRMQYYSQAQIKVANPVLSELEKAIRQKLSN